MISSSFLEALPYLIPLELLNLALLGIALYDLAKRQRVRGGNKLVWGAIITLVSFIGPLVYLTVGREED